MSGYHKSRNEKKASKEPGLDPKKGGEESCTRGDATIRILIKKNREEVNGKHQGTTGETDSNVAKDQGVCLHIKHAWTALSVAKN